LTDMRARHTHLDTVNKPWRCIALTSLTATLLYVAIVGVKTNFGLLVGGDFPGYYDWRYPLHYAPYAPDLIYSFGLLISNNNFYIGFYIYLFINIFISIFTVSVLVAEVVLRIGGHQDKRRVLMIVAIAALYFISQPLLYVNTFKSILRGLVWIQYTASYSLLLLSLLYAVEARSKSIAASLIALAIGPLSLPFPNDIRLIILYILTVFIYFMISMLLRIEKYKLKSITLILILFISVFFVKAHEEIAAKKEIIAIYSQQHGLRAPRPIKGMSIIDVFILASAWTRYTKFCPYCTAYFSGPVTILNITLIAAVIILTLCALQKSITRIELKAFLYSMLLLYVIAVFHESRGLILPALYTLVYSNMPLAALFSYAATLGQVAARYAVITALAASLALTRRKDLTLFLVMLALAASLASLRPLLDGSALSAYFNQTIRGVHIPQEYVDAKKLLIHAGSGLAGIVLPQMSTYILESWGYQGTQKFYHSFFYPFRIVYIGNYGEYINSSYYNLTTIRVKMINKTILKIEKIIYDKNKIILKLDKEINISRMNVFVIEITPDLKCNIMRVGLGGYKSTAWYIPLHGGLYVERNARYVRLEIIAGLFNKPWPSSALPDKVRSIYIVLQGVDCNTSHLNVSIELGVVAGLEDGYVDVLASRGIRVLIVDRGVVHGNVTDPQVLDTILKASSETSRIRLIMHNNFLSIFMINSTKRCLMKFYPQENTARSSSDISLR